jgi:S1-C subfamily serine protease
VPVCLWALELAQCARWRSGARVSRGTGVGARPARPAAETERPISPRPGDVIVKVGARPVDDLGGFWAAVSGEKLDDGVRLQVRSGSSMRFVILKSPDR